MQRYPLLILGHLAFVIGLAGLFIPGLPGVVFWLVAAWAYSKSCPHLHAKLLNNARYGQVLRDWRDHGVIPSRAKIFAGLSMLLSFGVLVAVSNNWLMPLLAATCMVPTYIYIVTRPSNAPSNAAGSVTQQLAAERQG